MKKAKFYIFEFKMAANFPKWPPVFKMTTLDRQNRELLFAFSLEASVIVLF